MPSKSFPSNEPIIGVHLDPSVDVCVDKISIVRRFESSQHSEEIRKAAYNIALSNKTEFLEVKSRNSLYRATFMATDPNEGESCLLQFDPFNSKAGAIRMEFNPAKLDGGAIEYAKCLAENFLDYGYQELLEHGKVTRLDVACDLTGIHLSQVCAVPSAAISSANYKRNGQIQTVYFGDKKSPRRYRLYDKAAQSNVGVGTKPITRIERTIRGDVCTLKDLGTIPPVFKGLHVCTWPDIPISTKKWDWYGFIALAKQETIAVALAHQPKKKRLQYRKVLKTHDPLNWSPKQVQAEYLAYLSHSKLLDLPNYQYGPVQAAE